VSKYILWCDIETTSKEVESAKPLELSAVITTCDLVRIGKLSTVIAHPQGSLDSFLSKWSAKQHTASGLLNECHAQSPHVTAALVEQRLVKFLDLFVEYTHAFPELLSTPLAALCPSFLPGSQATSPPLASSVSSTAFATRENGSETSHVDSPTQHCKILLAGSGVAFDHACLQAGMPRVSARLLDDVVLDVTPLLKAFTWWAPAWRDSKPVQQHPHDHRAESDIDDSLVLMDYYRRCLQLIDAYIAPSLPPSSLTGVSNPLHF
jgi:oligoribonuclease (3'-5' exoribonuclease)